MRAILAGANCNRLARTHNRESARRKQGRPKHGI
nr:MAG TPA: hypothetical protein [Bacteriophage sp.]